MSLERLYYSTSGYVCYIKIHAEMTEILQVKDCSFYIHYSLVAMLFDMLFHILS